MTIGPQQDSGPVPDTLFVRGGARLSGTVPISGFKHALVSCVALAAATDGEVRVQACPAIAETRSLARLVTGLGGRARLVGGQLSVDAAGMDRTEMPERDAASIHGSVYLLPALLARFGSVNMPPSGGCQIGGSGSMPRPVSQYVGVFERFGATARSRADGSLEVRTSRLTGCEIDLRDFTTGGREPTGPLYSGATKMALLTAALATGTSVLRTPYPKPDVTEMVALMRKLKVPVHCEADGSYVVEGRGAPLTGVSADHLLIPDLIEIVTWICAGALLGAEPMTMRAARMPDAKAALAPELSVLEKAGVRVDWDGDACTVHPAETLAAFDATVTSHGVFSDSQPLLALLAARAHGRSTIAETVWTGRFTYADNLRALGMDIEVDGARLAVNGPWHAAPREGACLHALDLRAAASVLLAALAVPSHTTLTGMGNLARGYPDLPGQLARCGASIVKENDA